MSGGGGSGTIYNLSLIVKRLITLYWSEEDRATLTFVTDFNNKNVLKKHIPPRYAA